MNDLRGKVSIERVGLKLGTVVGEVDIREVAAYLLREGVALRVFDTFGFSGFHLPVL